jgi:acetoin utilization deacetylase AcuC-like enzyme
MEAKLEDYGLVDVSSHAVMPMPLEKLTRSIVIIQDCAPFPEMADYVLEIAGSSLTAAKLLLPLTQSTERSDGSDAEDEGRSRKSSSTSDTSASKDRGPTYDVVINLEGGRHHAQRSKASGFCYVQDVVLAIGLLRKSKLASSIPPRLAPGRKPRILYLDLDVHFGDGVAAAFVHPYKYSYPLTTRQRSQPLPSVLTLSLHHLAPGFFPADPGAGLPAEDSSNPFTLSLPLKHATSNKTYARLWKSCVDPIMRAYNPDCAVILLGMDALAGDKLVEGAGNWSLNGEGGVKWHMEMLRAWRGAAVGRKLLVLGGGGYNIANVARGWTCATSTLVSRRVSAGHFDC